MTMVVRRTTDFGAQSQKGSMGTYLDQAPNRSYYSPRPKSRVGTSSEAMDILVKNRGSMDKFLKREGPSSYRSPRPNPKINGEGTEIAEKGRNGTMSNILNVEGNRGYSSSRPPSRVKPEAEEIATKNKGCMGTLMKAPTPRRSTSSTMFQTRSVKPEASDNYQQGRGTLTSMISNYGRLPLSARPAPRVKPDASDVAQKNRGTLSNMQYNYGHMPMSARPAPRVKSEASDIAELSMGTIGDLLGTVNKPQQNLRKSSMW